MADERLKSSSGTAGKQVNLPLNLLKAFPGIDAKDVSVLIVGGLGKGIALSVGVDNGDGTATLLTKDIVTPNAVRMRFPTGASGPHTFAITAISNDGHVKTGSLTVEPGLATVEDGLSFAIEQPVVMDGGSRLGFPVEIGFATGLSRMVGDIKLSLSGIPEGVHLTGGVPHGGGQWSLNDRDLFGLNMVVPESQGPFQVVLHVEARGQSGGLIEVTRTALVGLAGRSVLDPGRQTSSTEPSPSSPPPPPSAEPSNRAPGSSPGEGRARASALAPEILSERPAPAGPETSSLETARPQPKAAKDWLTGHGVFTFASGHGGDLFEGGYGWFDQMPDLGDDSLTGAAEDGSAKRTGMQVRLVASGPVIDGPEPISW